MKSLPLSVGFDYKKIEIENFKFTDYCLVLTYCKKCGLVGIKERSSSLPK